MSSPYHLGNEWCGRAGYLILWGVVLWWTEEKAGQQMQAVARNVNGGEGDLLADLGEPVRE